jgi:hypothetical protein
VKQIVVILVLFPFFIAISGEHSVPIDTKSNHLVLAVENAQPRALTGVRVAIESSPEWIQFSEEAVMLDSISAHDCKEAEFTFKVLEGKAGQTGTVRLIIQDKEGRTLTKHTIDMKTELSLKETTLFPSYPNPANPSATIRYGLVEPSKVKLKIYNVLGQHVRTLLDGEKPAGQYHVLWDGKNNEGFPLASGTYIVRLETIAKGKTRLQTSKLLLRK